MSEHLQHHPEQLPTPENEYSQEHPAHIEAVRHEKENNTELEKAARQEVDQQTSHQEYNLSEKEQSAAVTVSQPSRELKSIMRNRTLVRIRHHLSAPEKVFSRVIHQPLIDSASETAGKTIARPSGILSGGICALLGSSILLYISKHYGYRYNYLVFLAFFVGGFVIGLIVELLVAILRKGSKTL